MSRIKTERNLQMVSDYKYHKPLSQIAREAGLHPSTARACIVREMGEQEYLKVKKKKIQTTAVKNMMWYLGKRKSLANGQTKTS